MSELREKIAAKIAPHMRLISFNPDCETQEQNKQYALEVADTVLALIQKEQVWRDISSAPKDGRLMLLELDDGSIKLGRYHKSPTYSFLWWSEDAAPLSEPRRWCPTPPQGEDET